MFLLESAPLCGQKPMRGSYKIYKPKHERGSLHLRQYLSERGWAYCSAPEALPAEEMPRDA